MSITGFFLRNRYSLWALVVAIALLGVAAYRQIPVRLFPDTAPPLVNIVTTWPGATAADVNRDLSDVLETELTSMEGVATTTSTSQDNLSVIQVEFQYGTNVRLAAVDVQNAISRISDDLPSAAQPPRVLTFSTADRPIYTLGIVADDMLVARRMAEDAIAPRIQSLAGVAAVDVFGGRIPGVFVDVVPKRAEAHHLPLPLIANAIGKSNVSMPAGRVRGNQRETMLRVDQRRQGIEDFKDIRLPLKDGSQIRLETVANVYRGAATDDSWFGINGQRAIAIQIFRSEDANTVEVVGLVRDVIATLKTEYPEVRFLEGEESASFTEQSVSNLLTNVWQALLLASVILFFFLGRARAALVAAFSMPLAFGLTFAVMWKMDMEFNMVTLSAVILAVGMVVDASVVVLENIVRHRSQGKTAEDAARDGADEVWGPVLAGTATTVVVLVPLLGLTGFIGKVFGPLAMTLLIAFSSSVIVALLLVPILSLQLKDEGFFEVLAERVSRPFRGLMDAVKRGYLYMLDIGLSWRWLVLLLALASFGGGIYGLRAAGMDLLPRMDSGAFTVSFETPSGTSLVETTKIVKEIEAILSEQPEVVLVQSQAGFESGMKFTGGSGVMGPTQGFLSINLTPRTERGRSIWDIEEEVRAGIDRIPGIVSVVVKEVGNTAKPTTLAPIVARISGPDPLVLERLGSEVVTRLSTVNGMLEPIPAWRRDMHRTLVRVNEPVANTLGQTPHSVAQQLVMGAEGIPAGSWTSDLAPAEPVIVRYSQTKNPEIADMLAWPLFLANGDVVPMRSIAHSETVTEQGLYSTVNLNPVLDIRAGVSGRPLNFVVNDAKLAIEAMQIPRGYQVLIEGENKDLDKSKSSILGALLISVIAVYLLLVTQFRSWIHPLTVMMAVPLATSGVSLALWTVGKPVSMPVMIGLVLLVGTVVNNSILLVDVIRKLRMKGVPRREAIREGVNTRFRPIMMTSLSTIIGMLPLALELALGAERFSPLAAAVIGGLLVSTLLTMLVIPVLYDAADSFRWPFGKFPKAAPAKAIATSAVIAIALALPGRALAQESSSNVSLSEAWSMTLSHPAAKSAAQRIKAAQSGQLAAKRKSYPSGEFVGRASQLSYVEPALISIPLLLPDGSMAPPIQLGESIEQQYSLGVSLTQPLYTGGALTQGRLAAAAGLKAAHASKQATEAELWFGLVQVWYGLAVAEELVNIQQTVVTSARAREQSVTRLLEAGRITDLEVSSVSLKRAEAEQRLLEAQNTVASSTFSLEAFLGQKVTRSPSPILQLAEKDYNGAKTSNRSPLVDRAFAQAEVADAKAGVIRGSLRPSLALRLHGEYSNPNTRYFPIKSEFNATWDASLLLRWKFDSGSAKSDVRRAEYEASAALAGANALQRQTQIEFGQATSALKLSSSQLRVAAERVKLATRSVAATERALEQGRKTQTQLLEREAELGLARVAQQRTALSILIAQEKTRTLSGQYGPR